MHKRFQSTQEVMMKNQDEKLFLVILIGIAIMVGYASGQYDAKQQIKVEQRNGNK